eukprot:PhF_6_TR44240/c0_g1_i2/m.68028
MSVHVELGYDELWQVLNSLGEQQKPKQSKPKQQPDLPVPPPRHPDRIGIIHMLCSSTGTGCQHVTQYSLQKNLLRRNAVWSTNTAREPSAQCVLKIEVGKLKVGHSTCGATLEFGTDCSDDVIDSCSLATSLHPNSAFRDVGYYSSQTLRPETYDAKNRIRVYRLECRAKLETHLRLVIRCKHSESHTIRLLWIDVYANHYIVPQPSPSTSTSPSPPVIPSSIPPQSNQHRTSTNLNTHTQQHLLSTQDPPFLQEEQQAKEGDMYGQTHYDQEAQDFESDGVQSLCIAEDSDNNYDKGENDDEDPYYLDPTIQEQTTSRVQPSSNVKSKQNIELVERSPNVMHTSRTMKHPQQDFQQQPRHHQPPLHEFQQRPRENEQPPQQDFQHHQPVYHQTSHKTFTPPPSPTVQRRQTHSQQHHQSATIHHTMQPSPAVRKRTPKKQDCYDPVPAEVSETADQSRRLVSPPPPPFIESPMWGGHYEQPAQTQNYRSYQNTREQTIAPQPSYQNVVQFPSSVSTTTVHRAYSTDYSTSHHHHEPSRPTQHEYYSHQIPVPAVTLPTPTLARPPSPHSTTESVKAGRQAKRLMWQSVTTAKKPTPRHEERSIASQTLPLQLPSNIPSLRTTPSTSFIGQIEETIDPFTKIDCVVQKAFASALSPWEVLFPHLNESNGVLLCPQCYAADIPALLRMVHSTLVLLVHDDCTPVLNEVGSVVARGDSSRMMLFRPHGSMNRLIVVYESKLCPYGVQDILTEWYQRRYPYQSTSCSSVRFDCVLEGYEQHFLEVFPSILDLSPSTTSSNVYTYPRGEDTDNDELGKGISYVTDVLIGHPLIHALERKATRWHGMVLRGKGIEGGFIRVTITKAQGPDPPAPQPTNYHSTTGSYSRSHSYTSSNTISRSSSTQRNMVHTWQRVASVDPRNTIKVTLVMGDLTPDALLQGIVLSPLGSGMECVLTMASNCRWDVVATTTDVLGGCVSDDAMDHAYHWGNIYPKHVVVFYRYEHEVKSVLGMFAPVSSIAQANDL